MLIIQGPILLLFFQPDFYHLILLFNLIFLKIGSGDHLCNLSFRLRQLLGRNLIFSISYALKISSFGPPVVWRAGRNDEWKRLSTRSSVLFQDRHR